MFKHLTKDKNKDINEIRQPIQDMKTKITKEEE